MKKVLILFVAALAVIPPGAWGRDFDFCVRGASTEISQALRVRLAADLEDEPAARALAARLVNRLVWESKAERLAVRPDEAQVCADAAGERVTLGVNLQGVDRAALAVELQQPGPAAKPLLDAIVASRTEISRLMSGATKEGSVQSLRLFYATNRVVTGQGAAGTSYGAARGQVLARGRVEATLQVTAASKWLRPLALFRIQSALEPSKLVRVRRVTALAADPWRKEIAQMLAAVEQPRILLFVHGFAVSFEDAALRTAQLASDLGFEGVPVFYSWPSQGRLTAYVADKESARASVRHLKALLGELAVLAGPAAIDIVAHSMGNEVLLEAMRELRLEAVAPAWASLHEVVLAAPDVDLERFEQDIAPRVLIKAGPRVTLYASAKDLALDVSGWKQYGPRLGDIAHKVPLVAPMHTIDATAVKTNFLGHSYYGDSATVLSDLFYLLRAGLEPEKRFRLQAVDTAAGRYWRFK